MLHTLTFDLNPNQLAQLDFVGYAIPTEDFSDRPVGPNFETIDTASRLLLLDDVLNDCDVWFGSQKARLEGDTLVVALHADNDQLPRVKSALRHYLACV